MPTKITYGLVAGSLSVLVLSFKGEFRSAAPPTNVSGAPGGGLCTGCHTTFGVNSGGGNVVINGLPATFQPGQTYPFSVTISHGTADRTKWGFEINARNAANTGIGSFTPGPNTALVSGPSEIGHSGAVSTAASTSYTYGGLSWTAPATISAGDDQVRFYVAGNAANGNGNNAGDYIYSNSILAAPLPVTLKGITYKVIDEYKVEINWNTAGESNSKEFIVEKSNDNNQFYETGRVPAAGSSTAVKNYSFTDNQPAYFNQPVYYRLKLVDLDGKFTYSNVFYVTLKGRPVYMYAISPNPATDFISAGIIADRNAEVTISIISVNGIEVDRQKLQLEKGKRTYRMTIPPLNHGVYFLTLQLKNFAQTIGFTAL